MKGGSLVAVALALGAGITGCNSHHSGNTVYGSTVPSQGAVQTLESVAYGRGAFVAVGSGGAGSGSGDSIGAWVETSTDGVTWTVQASGDGADAGGDYSSLAYGSGGFIAVDETDGHTFTSTNGVNWADNTPKGALVAQQIEWDGTEYIVPVVTGLLVSPDGTTWTSIKLGPSSPIASSIVKAGPTWYGVVNAGNSVTVSTSSNLTTWTPLSTGLSASAIGSLAHLGGLFVVVGDAGAVATSPDGTTWTIQTPATANQLLQVAYNGNTYVAIGVHGTVICSSDGTTWTSVDITSQLPPLSTTSGGTTKSGFEFTSIAAAPNGAFVIIGGTPVRSVTSMDGIHWTIGKP